MPRPPSVRSRRLLGSVTASVLAALGLGQASARADSPVLSKPASYYNDVRPILARSCVACHKPGKLKGKLDLTTHAGVLAGGETGAAVTPEHPDKSLLVQQVSGPEPEMPPKGERLTEGEVAVLARWVKDGAKDDTPADARVATNPAGGLPPGPPAPEKPTVYRTAPIVTALAFAPDGSSLAVGGAFEVLLHAPDGSALLGRLPSGSPRIATIAFGPDARLLYAAGGAPGQFGQIVTFERVAPDKPADYRPAKDWLVAPDVPFGLAVTPSGDRLTFGSADRAGRVISAEGGGKEVARVEQHSDWVLGATLTRDGKFLVTAGRDKALKLWDAATGAPVEQINEPQDPIQCLARSPADDVAAIGCSTGSVRLYKVANLTPRTEKEKDPNRLKEVERQPGPVNAVAFSPDGTLLAVASTGEVRVYGVKDGSRKATLSGHAGPVFAVCFSPDGKRIATGGYDGQVRLFEVDKGKPIKGFTPVPLEAPAAGPRKGPTTAPAGPGAKS